MWECYCCCTYVSLLLSQLLSLPLPVNPTVSVVTPVAANTAFHLATDLHNCHLYWCWCHYCNVFYQTIYATFASLVVIYSELLHHFLLLFWYNFILVCCCHGDRGSSSLYFFLEFCLLQWLFFKRYWWKCSFHCNNNRQEIPTFPLSILL